MSEHENKNQYTHSNAPENVASPERTAIQELDATAERIFNEYEVSGPPSFVELPENTTVEHVWKRGTGARLTRTTADNVVSYKMSTQWHGDNDRGSTTSTWTSGGNTLTRGHESEMDGESPEVPVEIEDMQQLIARLNTMFPAKSERESHEHSPIVRRLLGRFVGRHSS